MNESWGSSQKLSPSRHNGVIMTMFCHHRDMIMEILWHGSHVLTNRGLKKFINIFFREVVHVYFNSIFFGAYFFEDVLGYRFFNF